MTAEQWIEAFAQAIGLSAPGKDEVDAILELASTAAHSSERTAAPVAAWLAGTSGKSLHEINEIARRVSGPGDGAEGE
jgi:Domain of unknown function (DUF6457)